MLILLSLVFAFASTLQARLDGADDRKANGVPQEYAGDWVCQTTMPGYNLQPPHADLSQPQTNKITTPSTVMILKFSLRTDGSYAAADAKGHYAFTPATNAVTWLDGPHEKTLTKTQLGRRANGAPKMELVSSNRYYGCFMPKRR